MFVNNKIPDQDDWICSSWWFFINLFYFENDQIRPLTGRMYVLYNEIMNIFSLIKKEARALRDT